MQTDMLCDFGMRRCADHGLSEGYKCGKLYYCCDARRALAGLRVTADRLSSQHTPRTYHFNAL